MVRQKMRTFNVERYQAMDEKLEKFLKAGFIRKVKYTDWLANVMSLKKF